MAALGARNRQQAVVDLEGHLRHDERPVLEQEIVGLEHATALRILDRDEREIHRLVGDPVKRMPQRAKGLRGRRGEGGVKRLFGVGARFPLVADRELACDGRTLSNEGPHPALPRKRGRGI